MKRNPKKKLSLTQFFAIYIGGLAVLLLIVALFSLIGKGDTKVLSPTATVSATDTISPAPTDTDATAAPTSEPTTSAATQRPTQAAATATPSGAVSTPAPNAADLSGLKVTIDPGHQAKAPGGKERSAPWSDAEKAKNTSGTSGVKTGIDEYIINLQIALKLRDALTAQGATVVMTRDNHGTSLSNQDRAAISNNNNVDVIIAIHCNGAESASAAGIEVYSRGEGDGTAEYKARSAAEAVLANSLIESVSAATGAKNRGARTSDAYTGINFANAPCFILECGFLSNEEEEAKLITEAYQAKIVTGVVNWLTTNKTTLKK